MPAKTQPSVNNPWALSACEIRTLELLIELGSQKAVARALGLSLRTVEVALANVCGKMGESTMRCALIWSSRNQNLKSAA